MVRGGYCGEPSGDHTYCETHLAICYNETKPLTFKGKKL